MEHAPNYFAFREDAAIQLIADLLADPDREISILDCGCHDARLAKAMMRAGLDVSRLRYFGIDENRAIVQAVQEEDFKDYRRFQIMLRDISDVGGHEAGAFDLIVVNNLLHEVLPERIPSMLAKLNDLLARPDGKLFLVDMEELTAEDCEPWAVTWCAKEVERILRAGGFSPIVSRHPKRVCAYRVVTNSIPSVNLTEVVLALFRILHEKKERLLATTARLRASRDISAYAQQEECRLAAVELSIHQLKRGGWPNELFREVGEGGAGGAGRRSAGANADLGQ